MGVIQNAKAMQKRGCTRVAAEYLKRQGYSLRAALFILTGQRNVLA